MPLQSYIGDEITSLDAFSNKSSRHILSHSSQVAVKGVIGLFSGSNSHLDPIRKIAREVRISRQVDHPHVIKLIDAYVPPVAEFDHVYLMFEHMDKSLWKVCSQ